MDRHGVPNGVFTGTWEDVLELLLFQVRTQYIGNGNESYIVPVLLTQEPYIVRPRIHLVERTPHDVPQNDKGFTCFPFGFLYLFSCPFLLLVGEPYLRAFPFYIRQAATYEMLVEVTPVAIRLSSFDIPFSWRTYPR